MGDGFSADGFAGAGRTGEVKCEGETSGVPLTESPVVEDEIVLRDLCEGEVEGAASRGGKDDIIEGSARCDGLDSAAAAGAKQTGKRDGRHGSTVALSWTESKRGGSDSHAGVWP